MSRIIRIRKSLCYLLSLLLYFCSAYYFFVNENWCSLFTIWADAFSVCFIMQSEWFFHFIWLAALLPFSSINWSIDGGHFSASNKSSFILGGILFWTRTLLNIIIFTSIIVNRSSFLKLQSANPCKKIKVTVTDYVESNFMFTYALKYT